MHRRSIWCVLLPLAATGFAVAPAHATEGAAAAPRAADFVAFESLNSVPGICRVDRRVPDPERYLTDATPKHADLAARFLAGKADLLVCQIALWGSKQPELESALARFEGQRNLEELYLSGQFSDADLRHLKELNRLRVLALESHSVAGTGLAWLKSAKDLKAIALYDDALSDAAFENLKAWPELEELQISQQWHTKNDKQRRNSGPHVTDEGLQWLSEVDHLKRLRLSGLDVTDAGLKPIRGLTKLQRLEITFLPIDGSGLLHLETMSDLRSLVLAVPTPAEAISRWRNLTKLEDLALLGTRLTDDGLSQLGAFENLRSLSISGEASISGRMLARVLANLPRLTVLDLAVLRGVDDDAIRPLPDLDELRELMLDYARVTAEGLKRIEPLKHLKRLELMHDEAIGDSGLTHIKDMKELETLRLVETGLTSKGLGSLKELTNLRLIDLSMNRINDDDLKALLSLRKLEEVDLSGTSVTDKGLRILRDNLPSLKRVEYGGVVWLRD